MDVISERWSFAEMSGIVCFWSNDMRLRLLAPYNVSNSLLHGVSRIVSYTFLEYGKQEEVSE